LAPGERECRSADQAEQEFADVVLRPGFSREVRSSQMSRAETTHEAGRMLQNARDQSTGSDRLRAKEAESYRSASRHDELEGAANANHSSHKAELNREPGMDIHDELEESTKSLSKFYIHAKPVSAPAAQQRQQQQQSKETISYNAQMQVPAIAASAAAGMANTVLSPGFQRSCDFTFLVGSDHPDEAVLIHAHKTVLATKSGSSCSSSSSSSFTFYPSPPS